MEEEHGTKTSPQLAGPSMIRPRQPKLLLAITEDWYFWSHRRSIARAAMDAGWHVTLASRYGSHRGRIEAMGVATVELPMERTGRNPVRETAAVGELAQLYRRVRPDVVHHVAIKPVLYGSWAAQLAGIPRVVNAISGLGYAFTGGGTKAKAYGTLARLGYRSVLRRSGTVTIFQNEEDRGVFVNLGLVRERDTVMIRGSGVDVDEFHPRPEPDGPFTVLYAGRMLWSKGVGDLVAAVARVKDRGLDTRLVLAGHSDQANPEAIPPDRLQEWQAEGAADWLGRRDDVADLMAMSHAVVLASEREGVPKVLVEAAGSGRPLIASDVPGCRDVVADGANGLLVPVHDVPALADAVYTLGSDPELRARMGAASRERALTEFNESRVTRETVAVYERLFAGVHQ